MLRARSYEAIPVLLAELEKHTVSAADRYQHSRQCHHGAGQHLQQLRRSTTQARRAALKVLNRFLNDGQAVVRTQAALALGKLGPAAAGAIPSLLSTLKDRGTWETRQAAAMALGYVGQDPSGKKGPSTDAIVGLGKALGTEPTSAVRLAVRAITGRLGNNAAASHKKQLIQYIDPVTTTKEPEPAVRIWAHMAVMTMGNEISETRLGNIAKMLDHADPLVRTCKRHRRWEAAAPRPRAPFVPWQTP